MVLRKDCLCGDTCNCPCRGRCTATAVDMFLSWSAHWAASGVRPEKDFDRLWSGRKHEQRGKPFLEYKDRPVRFILAEFRGDWDQYSGGFGFPRSNQHKFCWLCPCLSTDMYADDALLEYTHEQYVQIVKRCRLSVLVDRGTLEKVYASLEWDRRKDKGMHGRVLSCDIVVYDFRTRSYKPLLKSDRLEVGGCVWDIWESKLSCHSGTFPFSLVFWRKNSSVDFSFYSYLMDYLRLEELMIDDLHTLDLGPAARLGGHVAAEALKCGMYGNDATEAGLKSGCRFLTRDMRSFNKRGRKRGAHYLNKLTVNMLGLSNNLAGGHLHCKAGEARTFMPFALHLAKQLQPHLGDKGEHLFKAVRALSDCYDLMAASQDAIDSNLLGDLLDECLRQSKAAGVKLLHKFHLMRHLRALSFRAGNPAGFSAYADETKNSETIKLAITARTFDFSSRVLIKDYLQFHLSKHVDQNIS